VKFLRQGICLLVLGGGLAAVPGLTAAAAPDPARADRSLVQQMQDAAVGSLRISTDQATGKVSFVRAGLNGDLLPSSEAGPAAKASAYLTRFAPAFGAGKGQLVETDRSQSNGATTISYEQRYQGIDVFGAMLRVHVDADGDLTAVNGELVPVDGLSTKTHFSAEEAASRALAEVKSDPPGHSEDGEKVAADLDGLEAAKTDLVVYRHGLAAGERGRTELVYQVEVTNEANVRDMVFISAVTGKPVNRYSMIHNELHRELYEEAPTPANLVWQEGDDLPGTLNEDQESMVRSTGDAYWFFKNVFGRDSYDGLGAMMRTVNNDPTIQCPNANWNGVTTNYCDGVSSDDVVAHEWGHAYTEYTHGLIYQYQSGALNESYSDIWGETVDLINGRLDGDEGDLTMKRTVDQCSTHSPADPLLTINAPASIAKDCETGGAAFGPQLSGTGVTGDVVRGLDVDEDAVGDTDPENPFDLGGSVYDGCSPFANAADVAGKIVLVHRGLCAYNAKARNADAAGAAGVIVANRNVGEVFAMPGDGLGDPSISSVFVDRTDGEAIGAALDANETVNITMKDASGDRQDSFRWLMGEDSPSFGGAIRDMWSPTCYGDPGKVSDAQYYCGSDDGGGVHSNSGVPNHGYALLVDGGTYNGVAVSGIGLTKAAAIYYRAMAEYQTPVSNFTDHADSLEASCADLTGKAIRKLSTQEDDSQVAEVKISSADCAQVHAMTQAVEFRLDPTDQCDWHPMLDPNAPALCGADFVENTVWTEDFEDGLTGWTLSNENPFGGPTYDWSAETNTPAKELPGGHTGTVAFGPAPNAGACTGGTDDISGASYLTSGDIEVTGTGAPRLSFEHYVRTEAGYDGGNVSVSVNGGPMEVVPESAFTFNGYNADMEPAPGNTSTLAGEPGFTGTNPGSPFGSWGESQINLAQVGVAAGDTIKVEFAIGHDGCGGFEGWYVDNIKLVDCAEKAAATITAVHLPEPSAYGSSHKLLMTVTGDPSNIPTGTVTVKKGATTLGTGTLAAGVAEVSLPKTMAVGAHALTLEYSGDADYKASSAEKSVNVKKATSTTTATPAVTQVTKGKSFYVNVKVTAPGVKPTGVVKIYKGTTLLAQGTLVNGVVSIKVPTTNLAVGSHSLKAKYAGSSTVATSYKYFAIRVVR
jgi:Zn-dependent metalloprotease